MVEYIGKLHIETLSLAVVVSRFNEMITRSLLQGVFDGLKRYGLDDIEPTVAWVPGAYEIPLVAKQLALSGQYDAIICLGAVIRGATPHFDYVAGQAAAGIAQVGLESNMPVIFGLLTLDTIEQGLERAGTKMGNKGFETLQTAIEMVDLLRQLPKNQPVNLSRKKD